MSSGAGDNLFEQFGHAAIYVRSENEGRGVSFGGTGGFERGVGGFIRHYTAQGREVTVFILKTSPEQDEKMLAFMKGDANAGNKGGTLGADLMLTQNCTTAVCNVLEQGSNLSYLLISYGSDGQLDVASPEMYFGDMEELILGQPTRDIVFRDGLPLKNAGK